MARIVKGGRTQYAQGTSRFEAFRPERREYKRVKRRSNTEELLRLFALAEKIGNSPVGGAAIAGLQKLASNVQGTDKPTLKAAAAARAQAKAEVEGKPIPTPEEQGRAAGEAQADQFIQEAMKQPAPAIAELQRSDEKHKELLNVKLYDAEVTNLLHKWQLNASY
jgi:hypothetical protein